MHSRVRSVVAGVLCSLALQPVAGVGPHPAGQAPARALTEAEIRTWGEVLAMTDARRADSSLLAQALRASHPRLRAYAALAAGQLRVRSLASAIRVLVQDPDTGVAASAAHALGLLRDGGSIVVLSEALDGPPVVGVEAAWSLGAIADSLRRSRTDSSLLALADLARTVIQSRIAEPPHSAPVLGALLTAAAKLDPLPIDALLPHLRNAEEEVAWRAAYPISRNRSGDERAIEALLAAASSPHAKLRAQVARGLARPAVGEALADEAISALFALANDADAHVRVNAIASAATHGSVAAPALLRAVNDRDANVRVAAAQAAGRVFRDSAAVWPRLWRADSGYTYRRALLDSAVRRGLLIREHEEWVSARDSTLRAAAAALAGFLPSERMRGIVRQLTADPSAAVRRAAYSVMIQRSDSFPDARERLWSALADADAGVRATILNFLARSASNSDISAVLDLRDTWREDSIPVARAAALRFVASALRRDAAPLSDQLTARITGLMLPATTEEIVAAQGIPLLSHWPQPAQASLPGVAWYTELVRRLVVPSLGGRNPQVEMITPHGVVLLELFAADAPMTVNSFITLAQSGYFDGSRFHRVVPNFVVQGGDPSGTGSGGPGYRIRDELNRRRYERGTLGMAHSGPDTGGSQFFIAHSAQPHLDGVHTVFGRVSSGLGALDSIVQGDLLLRVGTR